MWNLLHSASLCSTCKDKTTRNRLFTDLLDTFRHVCPCEVCKSSFNEFLTMETFNKENDFEPETFAWELHNAVNSKLGKPLVTFENVYKRYKAQIKPLSEHEMWQVLYPTCQKMYHTNRRQTEKFAKTVLKIGENLPAMENNFIRLAIEEEMPGFVDNDVQYHDFLDKLTNVSNKLFPNFHDSIMVWGDTKLKLSAQDYDLL